MKRREISISEFPMPNTLPLEGKLLNSVLGDSFYMSDVLRIVKPDFFSIPENRKVWETIVRMHQSGEEANVSSVFPKVDRKNFIDNVLSAEPEYGQSVVQLALSLMDTYIKRKAYNDAIKILQGVESGALLENIASIFNDFSEDMKKELSDDNLRSSVDIANDLAEDIQNGRISKIATPFNSLNFLTYGGLGGGNLIILAARPSVGKTTIGLQMAQYAAYSNKKASYFSLEMTAKELVQRLITGTGEVSNIDIVTKQVNWENYERATAKAVSPNLRINDKAKTLDEICTRISLDVQTGNCNIAFVDYLGLVRHSDSRKTFAQVIGDITGRLKAVAMDCNIPIVLLSQLNRMSAMENRPPQLFDLRDSGAIEQDADLVLMLDRPRTEGVVEDNKIDMWVRKNRAGKVSMDEPIHLEGNAYYSDFHERFTSVVNEIASELPTDLFENM